MISVTSIFSSMGAPYLLAEGSLLHLFRNCNVGLSDLDFSLEQKGWKKNKKDLEEKLIMKGFACKSIDILFFIFLLLLFCFVSFTTTEQF